MDWDCFAATESGYPNVLKLQLHSEMISPYQCQSMLAQHALFLFFFHYYPPLVPEELTDVLKLQMTL